MKELQEQWSNHFDGNEVVILENDITLVVLVNDIVVLRVDKESELVTKVDLDHTNGTWKLFNATMNYLLVDEGIESKIA